VGLDAAQEQNREVLHSIADQGHEIGNHSFHHEPWLHLYSNSQLEGEIANAEESIEQATGARPRGFRGPGFSLSEPLINVLTRRGYLYDASTFPTYLGPLARAYYFMTARLPDGEEKRQRSKLFGTFADGLRPNKSYRWESSEASLIEIPVTTMPVFKVPIHVSYLLYASGFSSSLALMYFRAAMRLCKITGTQPSLLLHPLDFLGREDAPELAFFPAMNLETAIKVPFVAKILDEYAAAFEVVTMSQHAKHVESTNVPCVRPKFS
jgi:hypothetical protein